MCRISCYSNMLFIFFKGYSTLIIQTCIVTYVHIRNTLRAYFGFETESLQCMAVNYTHTWLLFANTRALHTITPRPKALLRPQLFVIINSSSMRLRFCGFLIRNFNIDGLNFLSTLPAIASFTKLLMYSSII